MGFAIQNAGGTVVADVDTKFKALAVSIRPAEVTGWFSLAGKSGAATGIAANGLIFVLRQAAAATLLLVRRVGLGFIATTGFTAAQVLDFQMLISRAYTVGPSGGTALAITGNTNKHRTSFASPTAIDCRISTTAALTAGTRTQDANFVSMIGAYATAAGVGAIIPPSPTNLFGHDPEDYPIVLQQNEGIEVQVTTTMGAGGVGNIYASVEFAEVTAYGS